MKKAILNYGVLAAVVLFVLSIVVLMAKRELGRIEDKRYKDKVFDSGTDCRAHVIAMLDAAIILNQAGQSELADSVKNEARIKKCSCDSILDYYHSIADK